MRTKSLIGVLVLGCTLAILFSTATGATDGPEPREGRKSTVSSKASSKDEFTHAVFLEDGTATW